MIVCKTILRRMKVGERIRESWLLRQEGMTMDRIEVMVEAGYLIKYSNTRKDIMSENHYSLTLSGREFAWD